MMLALVILKITDCLTDFRSELLSCNSKYVKGILEDPRARFIFLVCCSANQRDQEIVQQMNRLLTILISAHFLDKARPFIQ